MTENARAASDLLRIVRQMPECPAYLEEQMRRFSRMRPHDPMTGRATSAEDGAVEASLLLWDVSACEDLPGWARLEADALRRKAWPAGYLRSRAVMTEVDRLCGAP